MPKSFRMPLAALVAAFAFAALPATALAQGAADEYVLQLPQKGQGGNGGGGGGNGGSGGGGSTGGSGGGGGSTSAAPAPAAPSGGGTGTSSTGAEAAEPSSTGEAGEGAANRDRSNRDREQRAAERGSAGIGGNTVPVASSTGGATERAGSSNLLLGLGLIGGGILLGTGALVVMRRRSNGTDSPGPVL